MKIQSPAMRAGWHVPKRTKGQSTIEYVLIVSLIAIPSSWALWYVFFHPAPGESHSRLYAFLSLITDFVAW